MNLIERIDNFLNEKLMKFGGNYGNIIFLAGGAGCFDGDTLVNTKYGYKKISNIGVGEYVWTFSEKTGKRELCLVEEVKEFDEHPEEILELEFDNGEIVKCTENHEFYINDKWVKAKDIELYESL